MQLKRHLNPATVLSLVALFVALSGAAYAAGLGRKSVKTRHLGNGSVTALKLRKGAVSTPKLRNAAVSTAKLRNGAVSAAKLNSGLLAQLVKDVVYETKTSVLIASETPKEATVECTGGKVAIGGGAKVIGGTTVGLTDSGPTPPNAEGKRIGWSAAAAEMAADAGNWSVEVYAVCAQL